MSNDIQSCLLESEIDTIELELRKRKEQLLYSGDIRGADSMQDSIESLDNIPVCRGFRG